MPHDVDGYELEVGDTVSIKCKVVAVQQSNDYCNVTLETVIPMPPTDSPTTLNLNAKQVKLLDVPT